VTPAHTVCAKPSCYAHDVAYFSLSSSEYRANSHFGTLTVDFVNSAGRVRRPMKTLIHKFANESVLGNFNCQMAGTYALRIQHIDPWGTPGRSVSVWAQMLIMN
jgi:hypothetical protein